MAQLPPYELGPEEAIGFRQQTYDVQLDALVDTYFWPTEMAPENNLLDYLGQLHRGFPYTENIRLDCNNRPGLLYVAPTEKLPPNIDAGSIYQVQTIRNTVPEQRLTWLRARDASVSLHARPHHEFHFSYNTQYPRQRYAKALMRQTGTFVVRSALHQGFLD